MFEWISEVAKRIAGVVANGAERPRRRTLGGNGTSATRRGGLGVVAAFWIMASGGVATAADLPPVVTVSFSSTTAVADLTTPLSMIFTITNPNAAATLYGITVAGTGYPDAGWWPRYAATGSCFTTYHASISGDLTIIVDDPLGPGQSCTIVDKFYIPRAGGPYGYTTGPITSNAPTATSGSPVTADNTVTVLMASSGVSITSGGTAQSAMVDTGFASPLAIKAVDAWGDVYSGFDVVFTAPASGASAKFSNGASTITVQTDANGIASVPVTAGTTAGSYTVSATISGVTKTFSLTNIGNAVGFTVTPASNSVTAGTAKAVTVKAIDSTGNTVTGYSGTVHFTSTDPAAVLPADTTLTSGTKSVNVTLKTVGPRTITATDTSTAVAGTSSAITVTAAAAATLTAGTGTTPQSTAVSTAFPTNLAVGVTDAYGNAVSGASVSFSAPVSGASGTFAATGTRTTTVVTDASGVATASALAANATGGTYTATARISGLTAVGFTLTNIPPAPTVTSVSPTLGKQAGGDTVTINGTNLTGATAVRFGSVAAASYTVVSATKITATSPAGTGTVDVTVTTLGGTSAVSAADNFTYASTVSTLSALTLSEGTLSPSFVSATTAYTASVANGITSLTVTPTTTQAKATIKVNGTTVTSGSASGSIALAVGSNIITVVVTAQDGTTKSTYTVTVTRAASSVSTLSALTLSQGTLSPSFASGTTGYTASVANGVSSLRVTPTATQTNATIKVNGTAVASGSVSGAIALAVGSNTISVVVTAQDGVTTTTYTVTVTRAGSSTSSLSALSLSSGTLSPSFASATTAYTASVANGVSSLTVTPTATQANATIKVNGTTVASGAASGAISLAVGSNTISVVVIAQDGVTTTTYTVTVTRAGSSTSTLSALSLSSGTLSPSFSSGTKTYTASVANGVSSLTVTPTATQASATIKVDGTAVASGSASGAIAIAVGSNTISVVVTAQDGVTTTTYTVTVTRAAAGPVVSGLSPSRGPATGGTSVAITGSGFTGATAVTFGSSPATAFSVASATRIVATAPAGTGSGDVTVTTPTGTSSTGAAGRFTWVAGPVITAIGAQTMTFGTPASFGMKITGGYGALACSVHASGGAITDAGISFGTCVAGSNRVTVDAVAPGSAVLTLSVSDAAGQKASVDVAVSVLSSLAARTVIADKTLRVGTAAGSFVPVVGSGGIGALGYSIAPRLPAGLVFAAATGTISGTPTAVSAATSYTVTVTDTTRAQARASFSLGVLPAIGAEDDTAETKEGLAVAIRPTENDAGGPFTAVAVARRPSHGTATVSGLVVTYVPTVGFTGTDSFTYRAVKGADRSQEATVRITVAARPRPDRDPGVSGLINAQNQAVRLLGETQLRNFQQRLESLHGDGPAPDSFGIGLSGPPDDDRTVLGYDRTDPEIDRNRGVDPEGRGVTAIERRFADGAGDRGGRAAERSPRTPGGGDDRFDRTFSFWTAGALTIGNVSNRQGASGNSFSTSGVTAGVDHRLDPRLTVGVGVGYGRIATDIGNDGSNTVADQYAAAIYASFRPTRTSFLDGVAGIGRFDFTSARALDGHAAMATGRRGGREFFGSLTAGEEYRGTFDGHPWLVSPYARLDVVGGRLDGFTETSPVPGTALRYGAQSFGDVSVDLGLRGKIVIRTDFGSIAPNFRAEVQHDLQASPTATVSWADLIGGTIYTVPVNGLGQTRLMVGAGLDVDWYGYLIGLQYQATFAAASETQTVGMKVKKRF